jgi:hypothetical protein
VPTGCQRNEPAKATSAEEQVPFPALYAKPPSKSRLRDVKEAFVDP